MIIERHLRAGVDIGGTFTDLCLIGGSDIVVVGKGPTTPAEPARGVEAVLGETLSSLQRSPAAVRQVVHGTTLVTNALIERSGSRVALLMTAGFRDVLEIGRERRADLYDLRVEHPRPLVPRHLRFDVPERTLADGTIEQPRGRRNRRAAGPRSGAGAGNPRTRPEAEVLAEVIGGYVSLERAREHYGVAISYVGHADALVRTADDFEIDHEATAALRCGHDDEGGRA